MKKLCSVAILTLLSSSAALAQGVRVGPTLDVKIPAIRTKALQQHIPDRFPAEWSDLADQLERDRATLEKLRGPQLSGPKAMEASGVIDDVERIASVCTALERVRSGEAIPLEVRKAMSLRVQTPSGKPVNRQPVAANPTGRNGSSTGSSVQGAARVPLSPIASAEEVARLNGLCLSVRKYWSRPVVQPASELLQALSEAEKLVVRAMAGERLSSLDISGASGRLLKENRDPCEENARKGNMAEETGNPALAYSVFRDLEKQDCFDPSIVSHAREFIRAYIPDPPPVVPAAVVSNPAPSIAGREASPPRIDRAIPARPPGAEVPLSRSHGDVPRLGLDVWQSAWGDFSDLGLLGDYAKRNSITAVNLNPGSGVTPGSMTDAYQHLLPLVTRLRNAGVQEINYLYAELGYPIGGYADLLKQYHSRLGIGTIVDDSEFTDDKRRRFEENLVAVNARGLNYSAFITLESVGNSGVSDEMRFWAIEKIDQPILMSYFGCTLEEQRQALERYLIRADEARRVGAVRIAILLGGKSVGNERSCEQQLGAAELRQFLSDLDGWARHHPSYGGLVLETNQRLPRSDVGRKSAF